MLRASSTARRCAVGAPRAGSVLVRATAAVSSDVKIVNAAAAPLFQPFKLGKWELAHRMVYPPLTRNRATIDNVPQSELMAEYYSQRATKGGLVITEGTYTARRGIGYPAASGNYTDEQRDAWKPVVKAVKAKGAIFINQLFHCGRAAHPDMIGGLTPVAPSPIAPTGEHAQVYLGDGKFGTLPVPEELTKEGIKEVIADFRSAARRAIEAGFDGVEIHGANGYLIAQFTNSRTNKRTDEYGGSIENRCRFGLEIAKAVADEIGADRVGYRMSPFTDFLDCIDDESPYATYTYLTEQLNKLGLAYIHMIEGRIKGNDDCKCGDTLDPFRKVWRGAFIAAGGYNASSAGEAITSGHTDLVAFGRLWIANPDLPKRFALGAPLNRYDRDTFYAGGSKGYTDYPFLQE